MLLDVHTNIPLDYPTAKNGFIYTSDNILKVLSNPLFQERLSVGQLFGTFGPLDRLELAIEPEHASHVVRKVYISEDGELRFSVETLDNELGHKLVKAAEAGLVLAKMIVRLDRTVVNGKLNLADIKFVHIIGGDE